VKHGDDFDIEIGVVGTDGFSPKLMVLAETARLRTFIPE
jgi:hypothetical protein